MSLIDPLSFLVIFAAVFAGAVVSGFIGFAFSAVAGAILLHVLPPTEAVPLMMACSIVTQAVSLVVLRHSVKWRESTMLIAGGVIGVLPALYLLHHIDPHIFRVGFGTFLVAYAGYTMLRPAAASLGAVQGQLPSAAVGFGGGLVGGLTAMPGALPVMWCNLRGMAKEQQRGLVQPYITVMQLFALALMLTHYRFSSQLLLQLAFSVPALIAGVALGMILFRKIDGALFRSAVLVVLMVAGALLVI